MKKITEVKIGSKDLESSQVTNELRQFDLQTAYKLLISAYLRSAINDKKAESSKETQ